MKGAVALKRTAPLITINAAGGGAADGPGRQIVPRGTLIPVSGDYGLLAGASVARSLDYKVSLEPLLTEALHVTRITGTLLPDGTLKKASWPTGLSTKLHGRRCRKQARKRGS
ncbi:MAG: hypothetical protein WKF84_29065 [Pyrinomonadaceae bacterium]